MSLKRMHFTDAESGQSVSLDDLLDKYADKQAEKQQRKFDESLDTKLQPLVERIDKFEHRMDAQDERMKLFETQINELQASASAPDGAHPGTNSVFVPTFVDIKNFCEYRERKTKGISRDQAEKKSVTLLAPRPINPVQITSIAMVANA